MPSLRELQERFADAMLAGDRLAAAITPSGETSRADRLGIYRHTITANYRNALGATYPVIRRLVDTPFFHAAVDAYVVAHPSRSGDLNEYGATFGDYLAGYEPASDLRYLPDVARLEWAIDEANRAADSPRSPDTVLGTLARVPAEQLPALRMRMSPSCRLIASSFPVLRIWQVNQPDYRGDMRVNFDAQPDQLRILREPDGSALERGVALERVSACEFAWLAALLGGAALTAAIELARGADADFDLGGALHRFIGDGTITGLVR
jgi:Putative DNA-binding domain